MNGVEARDRSDSWRWHEELRRLVAIVKHFAEDSERRLEDMNVAAIEEVDKQEKYVVHNVV